MHKNIILIYFIMATIVTICVDTLFDNAYRFPSEISIKCYIEHYIPVIIAIVLEILRKIFKPKPIQRVIFVLHIILMILTILFYAFVIDFCKISKENDANIESMNQIETEILNYWQPYV